MDEKQWRTGALADVVVAETVDLGVFVGEAIVNRRDGGYSLRRAKDRPSGEGAVYMGNGKWETETRDKSHPAVGHVVKSAWSVGDPATLVISLDM
jgi:hypothetical protein